MNGKKYILAALFVFFAGVVLYNIVLFGTSTQPSAAAGRMERGLPRLKLDLSSAEKAPYQGVKRDIFNVPGQVEKTPLNVQKQVKTAEPAVPAPPPMPEPKAPSALQAFASEAKFMGFVDNSSNRTAFIVRGQDVYALKKGGYAGKFRVEDISNGNIILKDDETSEKTSIVY